MADFLQLIRYDEWGAVAALWSGRLLGSLVLVLVGWWLARRFANVFKRTIERRAGDVALASFLSNLAFGAMVLVVLVGALDLAGVPTNSVLAAMGAAGLAVGLALKDSLANVAAGVLLIVTRPFRAGDFVEAAGRSGTVQSINLMQTRLLTPDNAEITLPNGQVMNSAITNFTARPQRRLELVVTLPHDQDVPRAIEAMRARLSAHPLVDPEKPVEVVALKITPQGTDVAARPWIKTRELAASQSTLLAELRQALAESGVELPAAATLLKLVQAPPTGHN